MPTKIDVRIFEEFFIIGIDKEKITA